jgi:hypothetical protein
MKRHLSFIAAALGMCFFASNVTALAQQIKADTGSIAIGGSVTGSTVIIGIPQEKVDELVRDAKRPLEELTTQQRENIVLLKEKLDLNERQVRAALYILGENDIPPERLAAKLVEIAERFKNLQTTASARPGDDPKIAALKTDAQKAIDAGELAKADALLAEIEIANDLLRLSTGRRELVPETSFSNRRVRSLIQTTGPLQITALAHLHGFAKSPDLLRSLSTRSLRIGQPHLAHYLFRKRRVQVRADQLLKGIGDLLVLLHATPSSFLRQISLLNEVAKQLRIGTVSKA